MTSEKRILVIYAHPTPHHSRVNRRLAEAVQSVRNARLHNLYETYPDFYINVRAEQALLAQADLVVFQHPIQWYSMPSLLKEWIDVVFEYGWAYGPGGTALAGKDFWLVATTGSAASAYSEQSYHGHPFHAFLPPIRQTAALCGMRWLPPLVLHGARKVDDSLVDDHVATYLDRLHNYPDWASEAVAPRARPPARMPRT